MDTAVVETTPERTHIRVLAVDDSATIRETLALLLDAQPDMELVGTAASGQEAVRARRRAAT